MAEDIAVAGMAADTAGAGMVADIVVADIAEATVVVIAVADTGAVAGTVVAASPVISALYWLEDSCWRDSCRHFFL